MVRIVRCPAIARQCFTANQISGWPLDRVQYTPRQRRKRRVARLREHQRNDSPLPVVAVSIGKRCS